MSDPFTALRDAVRGALAAEWDSLRSGVHQPRAGSAEVIRRRAERLTELRQLMALALPAGIRAGFRGETVEARLNELGLAVEALTRWERGMERRDPVGVAYLDGPAVEWQQTESLDDQAEAHLAALAELVEAKLAAVMNVAVAAIQAPSPPPPKPRWDAERRELYFGGALCKKFRQPAKNQEPILQSFEEEGWPSRIDDPLPGDPEADTRQRLADAVRALNAKNAAILFELDGTSEGILWSPKAP